MLYTDGMVETRRNDIGIGIDRLIGQADRKLRSNFAGGAATLVDSRGQPRRRPGPAPASGATDVARRLTLDRREFGGVVAVWHHDPRVSRGRGDPPA